jgi:phage baseplate assembly protein V
MDSVFDSRSMIRKGAVLSIDDTGQAQMATVQLGPNDIRTVEVFQPWGQASLPPVDGCLALVFYIGGDPANAMAILSNPSVRFGDQASGESTIYGADGSRVAMRAGGTIEVVAASSVTIDAPGANITSTGMVTITAPAVTVSGNLVVSGNISATGTISP